MAQIASNGSRSGRSTETIAKPSPSPAPTELASALTTRANPIAAPSSLRRDWEAETYLFYRPDGKQTSLAAGGQLGGSQFAARVAWRPGGGPIGFAARAYAPLGGKGAEAAAGIDWHPFGDGSVRVSIERRQRLDAQGRSAWSAYAAGGFYRSRGSAELDGYAQAGVVGTERRDTFVDGALRIGYRLPTHGLIPILGAGLWGAAQPGVARVDVGPRAALRIPVGPHILTAALDGRLRLAGNARPGSGAALTLAADW